LLAQQHAQVACHNGDRRAEFVNGKRHGPGEELRFGTHADGLGRAINSGVGVYAILEPYDVVRGPGVTATHLID